MFCPEALRIMLREILCDAEKAHLHLAAMLEVLRGCHPAYKIEAGLYLGNLVNIQARINRVADGLCLVCADV